MYLVTLFVMVVAEGAWVGRGKGEVDEECSLVPFCLRTSTSKNWLQKISGAVTPPPAIDAARSVVQNFSPRSAAELVQHALSMRLIEGRL